MTVTMPQAANDDAPNLTGYVRGYRVAVWCDYCRDYHWHGLPRPGDTRHREPHCHNLASPYALHGYYLEPLVDMPDHIWRDVQRDQPRGPSSDS